MGADCRTKKGSVGGEEYTIKVVEATKERKKARKRAPHLQGNARRGEVQGQMIRGHRL